jgi:hypothetical protein
MRELSEKTMDSTSDSTGTGPPPENADARSREATGVKVCMVAGAK